MTYQSNIPLDTDLISVSQNDIKGNFQAIGTSWPVNHVDFNASGAGKHNFVEMPTQTSDPAGAADELTIFSRYTTLPATGTVQLYYKRNNEATAYQLTSTNPTTSTKGSTFLPGGLLLQWNLESTVADGQTYTFLNKFSAPPYSITITPLRNATAERSMYIKTGSVTNSEFSIRTDSTSFNGLYWMAIGPA